MRGAWLALALLAGCAAVETPPPPAPAGRPQAARAPSPADEIVAYIARLRALDEPGLAQETGRQREFARKAPADVASLKVALAIAASPQADEGELLALVEPLAREGSVADADVQAVASFLQASILERRRLREGAAAASAKAREDRRGYETQKQRADALQERNAQLQQKLDALTSLEQSLSSRRKQGN